MPSDHCYLIISPDPSEDLELEIRGKAYGTTENSKEKPKDRIPIVGKQLHFVKFGDEDNLRNRVNQYRTHNPSFWWRTIELTNPHGVDENLGKYLEKTYLKNLDKPYVQGEWNGYENGSAHLKELCKALNGELKAGEDWWTNVFDDKTKLDDFFEKHPFKK